jgi:hypothetical protein
MAVLATTVAQVGAAALLGFVGITGFISPGGATHLLGFNCTIKGNISIATGERIYHMPGQRYYDETVISPRYGERWFCSEAEAQAAGWRKAGD